MRAHAPTRLDHITAGLRWLLERFGLAAEALRAFEAAFGEPVRWLLERLQAGAGVLDTLHTLAVRLSALDRAFAAPRPCPS